MTDAPRLTDARLEEIFLSYRGTWVPEDILAALDELRERRAQSEGAQAKAVEADIRKAALAVAERDGCGLMVGGQRMLCDDVRAPKEVRWNICDCVKIAHTVLSALTPPRQTEEKTHE